MVTTIEDAARHGELVPIEFTSAPLLFETRYIQNAIKHRIVKALEFFDKQMESGEANAKDMDVQLRYLEFANKMGASQAEDPMEKYNQLARSITRSVTVKETVTEKGDG